jgi:hypothetical protein
MLNKLIDRFIVTSGDWNAQLFRELKSRLTVKNFVITTIFSLLSQGWFLISALLKLPSGKPHDELSRYSQQYCELNLSPLPLNSSDICHFSNSGSGYANGHIDVINWSMWWADLFTNLSGLMTVFLVVLGVYFLARDLRIEAKRGTLKFVQLSPQSAWGIFIGKILGVPILFYLAVGLAIPLQLIAGFYSNFGLFHTILWDLWWLVIITSFYLAAMLLSVMPIVITLFAWGLQTLVFLLMKYVVAGAIDNAFNLVLWNSVVLRDISWAILFGIGVCSLIVHCLWGLLEYSYNNPISQSED